jgi:hypothetical protein
MYSVRGCDIRFAAAADSVPADEYRKSSAPPQKATYEDRYTPWLIWISTALIRHFLTPAFLDIGAGFRDA